MIPIYSLAKPFLAQAVLELGISLDDTIGKHLTGLNDVYSLRTIGTLLNHTSGLSDYTALADYNSSVANLEPAWSQSELLTRCLVLPHDHAGFNYSNIGYLLLRQLVEQKTGQRYFEAIKQLVFDGLGLDGLGLDGFTEWQSVSSLVPGYDPEWVYSGTFLAEPQSIRTAFAALAKHRQGALGLSAGLVAVDFAETGLDHPGYNFGFMTDGGSRLEKPLLVGHGGGGPGFSHMILVDTTTWIAALETSTGPFNQAEAIGRLREQLAQNSL